MCLNDYRSTISPHMRSVAHVMRCHGKTFAVAEGSVAHVGLKTASPEPKTVVSVSANLSIIGICSGLET